jgi:putative aminopeptidase FrvX
MCFTRLSRFLASFGMVAASSVLGLLDLSPLQAQNSQPPLAELAARLSSIQAITGYEQALVDSVLAVVPGGARDRAGNARFAFGALPSKRLVVCPLDEPGYVVGAIRSDGYLTLRRVPGHVPGLFDQQLEGQRVTIQTRSHQVPGVVAVRSIHLTRGRTSLSDRPFTVDDAYVDVGAVSRAQVTALGVGVLAPVTLTKRPHAYGKGLLAAPSVGRRSACAALLGAVAQSRIRSKSLPPVTAAFVVEQELSQRGLATVASELGPFDETLVVDGRPGPRGALQQEADTSSARWQRLGRVTRWSLPVSYSGTPVETVSLQDADSLEHRLIRWIGGR